MKLNKHDKQEIEKLITYKELYKDWIKLSKEERIKKLIKIFKNYWQINKNSVLLL